jgi:hypothetical protein
MNNCGFCVVPLSLLSAGTKQPGHALTDVLILCLLRDISISLRSVELWCDR